MILLFILIARLIFADFMVPQARDIDISKYMRVPPNSSICVTPSIHDRYIKKPASIRRKKNPVVLNLDEISVSLSDDEGDGAASLSTAYSTRKPKLVKQKPVKRKLLEEDLSDEDSSDILGQSVSTETKLTKDRTRNNSYTQTNVESLKDIMNKVMFSIPDIEQSLMDLIEKDMPVTTKNVNKLIEEMEKLKVDPSTTQRRRKVKGTNQTVASYNKNLNRAIELLKDTTISERTNVNIDSRVEKLNSLPVQNEKTLDKYDEKTLTAETLKQSTDNASTSSTSQGKATRCRSTKLLVNNDVTGVKTRSSVRKTKEKPS